MKCNGKDYYFIRPDEFQQKIQAYEFVEWEMVYEGKYYGTLKSELERIWNNQQVPVLDIDVKGAIHVQQRYPKTSLSIFIEPPLRRRIEAPLAKPGYRNLRKPCRPGVNKASYEISFKHHFNEVIVNDDLEKACKTAKDIVRKFITS
jgi:guanylate kinase